MIQFFLILDFDRNNLFTYFCFSELLILREKKIRGFSFGPLKYQKNYKFSKNIEKTPYRRVAQKKVQFCTRRRKSHFFLTHPVQFSFIHIIIIYAYNSYLNIQFFFIHTILIHTFNSYLNIQFLFIHTILIHTYNSDLNIQCLFKHAF